MPVGPGGSSGDNSKINQTKYHLMILKNAEISAARKIQAVNAIGKLLFKVENPPEFILDDLIRCYQKEREGIVKSIVFQKAVQVYYPAPKAKKLFFETLESAKNTKPLITFYNPSALTEAFCERKFKLEYEEFKELFNFLHEYKASIIQDEDGINCLGISALFFSIVSSLEPYELDAVRVYVESSEWGSFLKSEEDFGNNYAQAVLSFLYPDKFKGVDLDLLEIGLGVVNCFGIGGEEDCLLVGNETSPPLEDLKEIFDELADADKPKDFLEGLLKSGKRVLAINAYDSALFLYDTDILEDFITLAESGDYRITHFAIPVHKNNESIIYKFLQGEDHPITNKLICDLYSTSEKFDDFLEAKDVFKSMISSFLSAGGEILFYGGEPELEGELLVENKANKIKEILDLDPSNRVILYSADYEMAKVDIDYVDSEPRVSFVKILSEVIGEDKVVSILSQDEDSWEMLEIELLDLLQILPEDCPEAVLKDFGTMLEGKKIGNLRFSLNSLQKFSEAFDGLIFRRDFGDDDSDGDDDSPIDLSPTESPELLLV